MKMKHISDSRRFSIVQEDISVCYTCKEPRKALHEIFNGIANRQKSKDYGMVVGLCEYHHSLAHKNGDYTRELKQLGQRIWESKYGSREDFIKVFGRNYL